MVPVAPDAVPTAPESVPTVPDAVFEVGEVAPETAFETVSTGLGAALEAVFVTVSTGPEAVLETVSTAFGAVVETVFVTVSTGSVVVLVTAVTRGIPAVVTGVGSIGPSSASACDGAHPSDMTATVTHMIEKRCALIDPFAMTRTPRRSTCPHGSHTPADPFLTRKS
jgi:hypothetical protein